MILKAKIALIFFVESIRMPYNRRYIKYQGKQMIFNGKFFILKK